MAGQRLLTTTPLYYCNWDSLQENTSQPDEGEPGENTERINTRTLVNNDKDRRNDLRWYKPKTITVKTTVTFYRFEHKGDSEEEIWLKVSVHNRPSEANAAFSAKRETSVNRPVMLCRLLKVFFEYTRKIYTLESFIRAIYTRKNKTRNFRINGTFRLK